MPRPPGVRPEAAWGLLGPPPPPPPVASRRRPWLHPTAPAPPRPLLRTWKAESGGAPGAAEPQVFRISDLQVRTMIRPAQAGRSGCRESRHRAAAKGAGSLTAMRVKSSRSMGRDPRRQSAVRYVKRSLLVNLQRTECGRPHTLASGLRPHPDICSVSWSALNRSLYPATAGMEAVQRTTT